MTRPFWLTMARADVSRLSESGSASIVRSVPQSPCTKSFTARATCRTGITFSQQRPDCDDPGPDRLVFEIAQDERTGAEEFDGCKIVRLAETILGDQF